MNHTKGPWRIFKSKVQGVWIDPIGLRVDDCGMPKYRIGNAHLISAAPDLLEAAILARALLGITEIFLGKEGMKALYEGDIKSFKTTQKYLEKAISKAEGKS